jgi:hypothetical protein
MTASATEFDTISPTDGTVDVVGVTCTVRRIKVRELMLAARVLTAGMGAGTISQFDFQKMSPNDWAAVLLTSIPDAGDAFVDLVNALVRPPDGIKDDELASVRAELANPDPGLLLDVIPNSSRR